MDPRKVYLLLALVLVFLSKSYPADLPDDSIDYSTWTPSQLHQKLGQMKARSLLEQRETAVSMSMTEAAKGQTDFDVLFYGVDIEVDIPGELIYGDVLIRARSLVDGLDSAQIDLAVTLTVDSVYTADSTLNYSHLNQIKIKLDKTYNTGEEFSFSIAYHGHPYGSGLAGFSFDEYSGNPVVSSLSEPYAARSWWPCKDRTDDKADSMDIFVTIDTAYFCASNGTMIDTVRNGDGTWTFNYEVRYPIVTYLFSVAISNYTIWNDWYHYAVDDSMEIIHYVYPDRYPLSLSSYSITPYALGVFSDLYGEYPFVHEKYGHANFEWAGCMEHQTVSSMGGGTFGFTEPVIVHEMSHQWWGDMITCSNWHEIWMNEGFASYSEALYYEVKNGKAAYHSYMNGMFYTGGGSIYIIDTTNVNNIFSLIVYNKGAWVLHMLRHIVGDSTFFNSLKTYYNSEFQYGDAGTEDFKNICETVSGMDLDYFFDDWIYGYFFPTYHWSYMSELDPEDGKYWTFLNLRQIQSSNPQVFRMPIDFVFSYPSDVDTVVIFNDVREKLYILKSDEAPLDIELDPDRWIHSYEYNIPWTYFLIPLPLDSGMHYESYVDSIIVRGGSGDNIFAIVSGALPTGVELNNSTGLISGTPLQSGDFTFSVYARDNLSTFKDTVEYVMTILEAPGEPGDANDDGVVNIFDITYLITYLYKGGEPPPVAWQADPNNDCDINIFDITYLISFLYKDGPAPLAGCAIL